MPEMTDSQGLPAEIECPRCAETIKARAKVCRFCGADIGRPVGRRGKRAPRRSASHAASVALDGSATTALVFGVLSLLVFPPLFGVLAMIQASSVEGRARAAGIRVPSQATTGKALGIAGMVLWGVVILLFWL